METTGGARYIDYAKKDRMWHLYKWQNSKKVIDDCFRFVRFEIDIHLFFKSKYGESAKQENIRCLVENDGYDEARFKAIRDKISDCCKFMRNGTGEIVSKIANVLIEQGGCGDDALIVLIGLAICVRNSVCREKEPEGWTFKHGDECYETVNDVVRTLFERKIRDGEPIWWRKLMREIVAYMGIFSYLNAPIQKSN